MKDKFIRILSPMTLAVVILLDLAVIGYGVFAVYRLTQVRTGMTVIFAIIEIAAIVIAVLTTKETVKNGLLLRATDFEFTGMDKDNVYAYNQIKDITGYKDEAPSLVKNFIDRHAVLTLTLTDDTTVLLDLGLCQKRTLEAVQKPYANAAAWITSPLPLRPSWNSNPCVSGARRKKQRNSPTPQKPPQPQTSRTTL